MKQFKVWMYARMQGAIGCYALEVATVQAEDRVGAVDAAGRVLNECGFETAGVASMVELPAQVAA